MAESYCLAANALFPASLSSVACAMAGMRRRMGYTGYTHVGHRTGLLLSGLLLSVDPWNNREKGDVTDVTQRRTVGADSRNRLNGWRPEFRAG